jgi:hypothetical protein
MAGYHIKGTRIARRGNKVHLEIDCGDAYAAEVFKDDLLDMAERHGFVRITLRVKKPVQVK